MSIQDRLAEVRATVATVLIATRAATSGRYSRDAWIAATLLLGGALYLIVVPFETFLWTTPRPLQDLYSVAAVGTAMACVGGLAFAYVRRLRDQNRTGLWAAALLLGLPLGLCAIASAWGNRVWEQDHSTSVSAYTSVAMTTAAILAFAVALLPPRPTDRFGDRLTAAQVLRPRSPPVAIALVVASGVTAVAIYAGYFQDGLWVRKGQFEADRGTASAIGSGIVIANCGGAKGVSAFAQQGQAGGFVRDAAPGSWVIVKTDDGGYDIQTFGKYGNVSYRADGFTVEAPGLRTDDQGQVASDIDNFQIIAIGNNPAGDMRTVTVLSFAKLDFGYQAVISTSRILGKNSILGGLYGHHSRASSYMMLADCFVTQG